MYVTKKQSQHLSKHYANRCLFVFGQTPHICNVLAVESMQTLNLSITLFGMRLEVIGSSNDL